MLHHWKTDIVWGILGGLATIGYANHLACTPTEVIAVKAATYQEKLEECSRKSQTLCESIQCENEWRDKEGRMRRKIPSHCLADGGSK